MTRINEGSHAVEYFFNETEPDLKQRQQVTGRRSPFEQVDPVRGRQSRFKTESVEDERDCDSAIVDSCEEDSEIDECDIDSNELQEANQYQTVQRSELY